MRNIRSLGMTSAMPVASGICSEVPASLAFISEAGIMDLPSGWSLKGGAFYHVSEMIVLASEEEFDGATWLHVSMSRRRTLPSWKDVGMVKNAFVGKDRLALQVFAPEDEHINHHPNVLHLWCNLDRRPVPDFRRYLPGLGLTL